MPQTKIRNAQLLIATDLDANSKKIINLANPVSANDAANKAYVDSVVQGLDIKGSVRVATTGNITLTNVQTIDGINVLANDRVLVKNQSDGTQNGIYVVSATAWVRAADMAAGSSAAGAFVFVEEGTTNADSGWVCTTNLGGPDTVGTDALAFAQFSGAGQVIAGNGLTKTGNSIDVVTANSGRIVVNADNIDLATTGVTAGTYTKVTVDAYGRVTTATSIAAADLPSSIDATKIGGGLVDNTEFGYLNGVTSAIQTQLDNKQPLDSDLTAIAALATNGLIARTATGTAAVRTVTGTSGRVSVTNGDGVAGNPTIDLATSGASAGTYTKVTVDVYGRVTSATSIAATDLPSAIDAAKIANGSVSNTEFQYLDGVTSSIQTQINNSVQYSNQRFEAPTGSINGTNTAFTLTATPQNGNFVSVFLNGLLQQPGVGNDYTISGTTITFTSAPIAGDVILVQYFT